MIDQAKRFPPVLFATCTIPWDSAYRLDEPLFRQEVRRRGAVTRHLYVFGTAGEGYAVSEGQYRAVGAAFLDEAHTVGVEPTLGVVSLSLETIVERIEWARSVGCRSFQLSFPCWGTLRESEIDAFFDATCGRFEDCSFHHYNQTRTKLLLGPEQCRRLSGRHPNLVGVKYSTTDLEALRLCIDAAPELQFFPTEFGYSRLRDRRECGLLASVAMFDFGLARSYHAARGTELARLGDRCAEVERLLVEAISPYAHMDGAFEKAISKLHDPGFPLRLLPPYEGAPDAAFSAFAAAIR